MYELIEEIEFMGDMLDQLKKFRIGKRVLKTAVAVFLCFVVYALRGEQANAFNCAVAAIICMQSNVGRSWKMALNRIIGTVIGTVYGIIVVYLFYYNVLDAMWLYPVIALGVILVLETAVVVKQAQIADFACVTFLSISITNMAGSAPYLFVLNRVLDTLVGIAIAITINYMRFPKKKRRDVLFVADLDHTLRGEDGRIPSYSKIIMNMMIEDGAMISFSTTGTPATLLDIKENLNINIPVIVMDGCALYDVMNNKYIAKTPLSVSAVEALNQIAKDMDMVCNYSTIVQDVLLIYFERFSHMVMQQMYRQLRKSPYRNYICAELPEETKQHVMYVSVLDQKEKIHAFSDAIKNWPVFGELRIRCEELEEYPDYAYLRIYNREASRKNAVEHLGKMMGARKVVTFGRKKWSYDVVIKSSDPTSVVRKIKRRFELDLWRKD